MALLIWGDKQFAVIIDEAHSSQSGSAHDNMNRAIGKTEDLDAEDVQDLIYSYAIPQNARQCVVFCFHRHTEKQHFGKIRRENRRMVNLSRSTFIP